MASGGQKNLVLILARELASQLATAMFVADAEGELVFYNEPAEDILGRTFAEAGEMRADEWTALFQPETLAGEPMRLGQLPPASRFSSGSRPTASSASQGWTGEGESSRSPRFRSLPMLTGSSGCSPSSGSSPKIETAREGRLRVRIWGCRGSLATPGAGTVRYGGNTSCVEVRLADGTPLVLDAGTGIRPLGLAIAAPRPQTLHLLLTHLHVDHIEGLGFFGPLWSHGTDLHVWGPPSPVRSLAERIAGYYSRPLFPVALSDVPAHLTFHDVPTGEWAIGAARVLAEPVSHPGPTVGYRLSEAGRSFAYIPDHEPALGVDLSDVAPEWVSGSRLAQDVDVLFHDSQYTADEYRDRVGWGHSSVGHAVAFAQLTKARRLVMFHHDPNHTDEDLELLVGQAGELWGDGGEPPVLAYEGMEVDLARAGETQAPPS